MLVPGVATAHALDVCGKCAGNGCDYAVGEEVMTQDQNAILRRIRNDLQLMHEDDNAPRYIREMCISIKRLLEELFPESRNPVKPGARNTKRGLVEWPTTHDEIREAFK